MWKATGSYRTYSIPGKTAALVPEFAVEDLPLAELQPDSCICSEGFALGQKILMMINSFKPTLQFISSLIKKLLKFEETF